MLPNKQYQTQFIHQCFKKTSKQVGHLENLGFANLVHQTNCNNLRTLHQGENF